MYKLLTNPAMVLRVDDGSYIPTTDPRNIDYQAYQKWLAAGNTPLPVDPPGPPTQIDIDRQAIDNYPKLNALRNMTPAQVQAWVDANVIDLASARDAIKTLAIAVGFLARAL